MHQGRDNPFAPYKRVIRQALCPALDALLTWVDLKETLTEAPRSAP
jgi:hypothetical protein